MADLTFPLVAFPLTNPQLATKLLEVGDGKQFLSSGFNGKPVTSPLFSSVQTKLVNRVADTLALLRSSSRLCGKY
ncbi:hypothetical protein JTE90_011791 [Oedothorax gibbosus]|uniref:Uncharacterized protein n=1 Tax=Oedothorax gibbosus TaxID=931172 RepID=A0AAV6VTB2_9ARAC|nr:hypothetical protein JTE90_011791 [Oedothorax gibbosus]